ncbi:MAG: PqqD family protein [archaeon]
MNLKSVPAKCEDVVARAIEEEEVVVHPGKGTINLMNVTAKEIWDQIDGKNSIAEIIEFIQDSYDCGTEEAREDVIALLETLKKRKLIRVENA